LDWHFGGVGGRFDFFIIPNLAKPVVFNMRMHRVPAALTCSFLLVLAQANAVKRTKNPTQKKLPPVKQFFENPPA
jgi:hypothetical protein